MCSGRAGRDLDRAACGRVPQGVLSILGAISIDDLESSAHVAIEGQIIEVPASEPGRAPGGDDFTRNQRAVINPGV